ncbi:hypothetical protein BUALT_Bualt19G0029900 [Buddleja alternifolia]|uniref:Uncharacterized protein n=1 Tax=Buddleja alternifolia TaxID=168488 RepID=A0AAV6W6P4_9LAMI|nr:hypothetical protein BUALT_Bualt19G0029900 [Buddleja alternifolia]
MNSGTTKQSNKGKRNHVDGVVGPIMDSLNRFTDHTDVRLGDIESKMGHEYDLTRKCEAVFDIVNQIEDLTLDDKLVATNMIVKNTQVLAMFFSLSDHAKVGQVAAMDREYSPADVSEVFEDDIVEGCVVNPGGVDDVPVDLADEPKIVPDPDYLEYLIRLSFGHEME